MKIKRTVFFLGIVLFSVFTISWGTFGHEHINRAAVFSLPPELQPFFYNHIDFITQESTVPDIRKYTLSDRSENARHFIDLENFPAIDSMPKTMEEAKKKWDEKFLNQNGILYWYVPELMEKLTAAFKEKKKTEILFLAADLGHYLGDTHMPLHTSVNHDGQLTNQKGIHALWESRLPDIYGLSYNYQLGKAQYIENIQAEFLKIILHSHQLKDSLLLKDSGLKKTFAENKIYKLDLNGQVLKNKYGKPNFSDDYASALHQVLNGMVEKQMRASIQTTANFWYTAWVNAGSPDLSNLDPPELTKRNRKHLKQERKLLEKGALFGIKSEKEF